MKERPIIFSPEMVRAILDGRKTETRRAAHRAKLYGEPGDVLWVRERHAITEDGGVAYYADYIKRELPFAISRWRQSIHMRRTYARLLLRVEHVAEERLGDICDDGAQREGFKDRDGFFEYWGEINGPLHENPGVRARQLNERVVVVRFSVMETRRLTSLNHWPNSRRCWRVEVSDEHCPV
jgi:hypothetical protein